MNDLRLAWRNAIKRPAFTLLVTATLGVGLGISAAVFAIADAVLLRPLPYRDPARLVFVWQTLPDHNVFELEPTPADYTTYETLDVFSSVAMVATGSFTLDGDGGAERVRGARVTSTLMPLLGVAPALGRAFLPAEDTSSAAPAVILGDGLWRRRYGADASIVGRSIRIDGVPRTVVGVMAARASLPGHIAGFSDVWLPARLTPEERTNAISHNYTVIGRLAGDVPVDAASARFAGFAARVAVEQPSTHRGLGGRLVSIADDTVRPIKPALLVLTAGVLLLLLIACANVSTLLMVRAADRRRDAAVRAALGAPRSRMISLSLAESVLLAGAGGAAGVAIASSALQAIVRLLSDSLPPSLELHVGLRVTGATALAALVVGVALGLAVAFRSPSEGLADALTSGARTAGSRRSARARDVLVVTQVAFAVVLLGIGGLLVHSLVRLARVPTGFVPDRVLTVSLSLDGTAYDAEARRAAFVRRLVEEAVSAPGIEQAAVTSRLPLSGTRGANGVEIEGRPSENERLIVDQRHVSPDYFRAMGIRLLRGRAFTDADAENGEPVTIVNRTMADQFWPHADPIGQRVRLTGGFDSGGWFRIVGILDDVRHVSLTRAAVPEMYRPFAQAPVRTLTLVLKTKADPDGAAPTARSIVQTLDPTLAVYDVRTMEDRIAGSMTQLRSTMLLLMMTAALAAVLAAVAIYGSIWYAVSQRIPEIGLRLALGASRASICRTVLGRAFVLSTAGVTAGVAAAVGGAPILGGLLFDTPRTDPATYAVVIAGVLALTALASAVPARRAMRVDPITAIRT